MSLDKETLLARADKIVEFPMPVFVRALDRSLEKYTKGIKLTHEQLYNTEMEGSIFFNGKTWSLYDRHQNWVAELAREFVEFTGRDELELSAPDLESFLKESEQLKKEEEHLTLEYPSYREYIDYLFSDDYVMLDPSAYKIRPCSREEDQEVETTS